LGTVDDRPREVLIRTEREADGRVRLSVADVGTGFDPQDVHKLFAAFYSTKHDGMGVGLSVSRSIIEKHQGRLWAVLNDGPGATFAFSLPCRAGAGEAESAKLRAASVSESNDSNTVTRQVMKSRS
jgi:signal transduction histidine kinase